MPETQTTTISGAQLEEVKDLCRRSLSFLCTEILNYKDWDLVHDDIEFMLCKSSKRKMILVPRGHLKTAIVTKGYTIQALLKNPNARILIANQVWDKAREMLYEIKEYLTNKSDLPKLFGQFESGRWTADDIVIKQRTKALAAATISTTGVEAETTSSHFDLIILDDLQGLQNYQTPDQREKVKRFYRSMLDLLEPSGQLIVLGTRWHLDDIYQHIMDNESQYFDIMVRKVVENGKIIFPKKFQMKFDDRIKTWKQSETHCMDFIDYLKKSKGAEFYSQYMNDPIDEENQLFKKAYFKYWNRRPERLFLGLTCDPAISEKQEADNTALVLAGMDDNHDIYVLDYQIGKWSPYQIIENIFVKMMQWRPNVFALETVGFQKTLKYMLEEEMRKRKFHFPVEELRHQSTQSKEMRIKALEPYYRAGKIFHAEWMKDKDLELELQAFPRAKRDDLSDALASQLEILFPGGSLPREQMPPGCWEAERLKAVRSTLPYMDFFKR